MSTLSRITSLLASGALGATLLASGSLAPASAAPPERPGAGQTGQPGQPDKPGQPGKVTVPTLTGRATLSADHLAPGPPSGAQATPANGRQGPFDGQVVPGFSAMVEAGDGSYWAQPDNGFGAQTNSADFLLRIYRVKPRWETADGGPGEVRVQRFVSLRDPNGQVPFPIQNDGTPERLLTGADFDIESLVAAPDGTFWIGEEFGPYVLHVARNGVVLDAPIPLPGVRSPQSPDLAPGESPTLPASKGFEAMTGSPDGRYLYPVLEGALTADADQRRRVVHELDTRTQRYTGRTWRYEVDEAPNLVGDAWMRDRHRMVVLERDNLDGAAAVTKRLYEVDLRRTDAEGNLVKTLLVDLTTIANPDRIGVATDPGAYGVSDPFSFPFVSVEVVLGLRDGQLLVANDNNSPGDDARRPVTPDDTELITIDLRRERAPEPNSRLVVGHRGASGDRPEHTLASYEEAIRQCADFIEPDLVPTKDGALVARHENEIGGTTDVATRPEFADRRTTKTVDGVRYTGWFTEDFTLAELKTLRAKERIPGTRPQNTRFDGLYAVPTLDEVLDLARHSRACDGSPVGVYIETKHPTYFDGLGLSMEEPLVEELERNGFGDTPDRVFLQSFETTNLRDLDRMTDLPLVQLTGCSGAPYDLVVRGDRRTYADLVTRAGLRRVSRYADGLGPCKDQVIPRDAQGRLLRPTAVVDDAHRFDLLVHPYTFRVENQVLPAQFRRGTDPNAPGDLAGELRVFLRAGIDGFFTDNPALGVRALR